MERPIYWNISHVWLMYVVLAGALGVFVYGVRQHLRRWKLGPEARKDLGPRLLRLAKQVLLQTRTSKRGYPGLFHGLIFYSFLVLLITTTVVFIDADFGLPIFRGWSYLILSLGSDIGGVLLLVGLGLAAWRRYTRADQNLDRGVGDAAVVVYLAVIVVTGYAVEALRIRYTGEAYGAFSFVGVALSGPLHGMSEDTGRALHRGLWWFHMVLAMGFVAMIPFTKLFHLVVIPLSALFADLTASPAVKRVDLDALMSAPDFDESKFQVGIASLKDFTWKTRFDLDACIACGRCQNACPATRAGDPFGPKDFILTLRQYAEAQERQLEKTPDAVPLPIIGQTLSDNYVWYCRTCRACVNECPANIDHLTPFIELRRNEVLMKGQMPEGAQAVLKQLESTGTPFGHQSVRTDFFQAAGFKTVAPGETVEALYFVGCLSCFDPPKQRIARDFGRLLDLAGVSWGTLGGDEVCCGDPARVVGNEMLFQSMAKAQLAAFTSRTFKYIVANDPHCLNTLKNEYRSFGANLEVIHHSELIARLLAEGRLKPTHRSERQVTFHDPCYLGRYQGQVEAPREVLAAIPGKRAVEMQDNKQFSMCCGAGGGHFWMDFKAPHRINNLRMKQALDVNADTVATGCPYCLSMLTDSVSLLDLGEKMEVADVATLTLRSIEGPPAAEPAVAAPAQPARDPAPA